jgi:hypothetical protein
MLRQAAGRKGPISAVSKSLTRLDERRFALLPGRSSPYSHRVVVMPDDFAWSGETFDSLFEIAFAITGPKWSGPSGTGGADQCWGGRMKSAGRVRCAILKREIRLPFGGYDPTLTSPIVDLDQSSQSI